MRLVRLVVAGVVLGAVGGFVVALLRPRAVHRNPAGDLGARDQVPLPERDDVTFPELSTVPDTGEAHR